MSFCLHNPSVFYFLPLLFGTSAPVKKTTFFTDFFSFIFGDKLTEFSFQYIFRSDFL